VSFDVRDLCERDLQYALPIANRVGGNDYYTDEILLSYLRHSTRDGVCCALAAWDSQATMLGFRLTLPPGNWSRGRGRGHTPSAWPADVSRLGYFQSCFIEAQHTGQGIGRALSEEAIRRLRSLGARGVVAHSWKESPHNSSQRALTRLGFTVITEHEDYWSEIPYHCHRCGTPCRCTALEMVLDLPELPHSAGDA